MYTKVKGVVSSEYSRLDIDTMLDFKFIESLVNGLKKLKMKDIVIIQ